MRNIIGYILMFGIGIYVFIYELKLIYELWNIIGVLVALFIFPVTLSIMPFYALFKYGNWLLIVLSILNLVIPIFIMKKKY